MADTIESFVAKLQAEGVQAGQEEARKLREDAQKQAEKIVADAEAKAEKIVADAESQGKAIVTRARTELDLAARDVALRLRKSLEKAIEAVLSAGAGAKLQDAGFLEKLLHELIVLHAKSRLEGTDAIRINVSSELHEKLANWAFQEVARQKDSGPDVSVDLEGTLSSAGFEYTVSGATVDVTLPSVVETLCEMVNPKLREILEKAAAQDDRPRSDK